MTQSILAGHPMNVEDFADDYILVTVENITGKKAAWFFENEEQLYSMYQHLKQCHSSFYKSIKVYGNMIEIDTEVL